VTFSYMCDMTHLYVRRAFSCGMPHLCVRRDSFIHVRRDSFIHVRRDSFIRVTCLFVFTRDIFIYTYATNPIQKVRRDPAICIYATWPIHISAPWLNMRDIPHSNVRQDSFVYAQDDLYSWTGASPHFHYASFRSMVFGRARWFLWPPARAFYSTRDIYDWFLSEYPMLRYIYIFIYTCVCVCINIHICTGMYIFGRAR